MPIYEYQCAACGMIVEKWQRLSEEPSRICPQCGGSMNKLVSCCSFQLKGNGWYQTDYSGKMQTSHMAGTSKVPAGSAAAGGKEAGETPKTEKADKTDKTETIPFGKIK